MTLTLLLSDRLTRPLHLLHHPREVVRQFTPNWFTVTMGTGVLALALNQLPMPIPGLKVLAEGLWLLNIILFVSFSLLYAARWVFFFDEARRIFGHGVMSMFFGAIPMGLATLINGTLGFGVARWGVAAVNVAHVLWWIDVAMALACAWLLPYLMVTRQEHRLQDMTGVWLLPIVAAEVTAASGGLLIAHLGDGPEALRILFLSYALWGTSVLPAMGILVILFLRLVLHKLPKPEMAVSSWLALGPIGTGALGLLLLGEQAARLATATPMADFAAAFRAIGIVGAGILWGYGIWWLVLAALMTLRYRRDGLPFNMGWWGFTFPLGVFSLATLALARITGIGLFQIAGEGFVVLLALLWTAVAIRTFRGGYSGRLFDAPCLASAACSNATVVDGWDR